MKIFVLVTLLTLHERTLAAFTCKKVDTWPTAGDDFDLQDEPDCDTQCTRPKVGEDGNYVAPSESGPKVIWGCGACEPLGNCIQCSTEGCNDKATKCWGNEANTEVKTCADTAGGSDEDSATVGAKTCVRPKVTSLSGTYNAVDTKWGCGGCTEEGNCIDPCETSKCNTAKEPSEITCRKYTKTADAMWEMVADSDKAKCYDIDGGEATTGCKMPTPDAEGEGNYDVCAGATTTCSDDTCKACNTADCNNIDNSRYCEVGDSDTAKADLKTNFCSTDNSNCKRPKIVYGTVPEVDYACGDCGGAEDCVQCGTSGCNQVADASINCFAWSKGSEKWTVASAATACVHGDGDPTCSMPKDVSKIAEEYTGTGCGPCKETDTGCMVAAAEKNKQLIKCYTWSKDGDKWAPTTDTEDCTLGDGEAKCNLPKDRNKIDGYTGDGCGACASGEEGCMSTEPEKNAARHVVLSLLVSLIPLLYVLL